MQVAYSLLAVFLAVLVATLLAMRSQQLVDIAAIGTGYGAMLGCNFVFVSGRSLASVLDAEFVFPPIKYVVSTSVDREALCVTATSRWFLPTVSRRACWRTPALGCALDAPLNPGGKAAQADALRVLSGRIGPWPRGDDAVDPGRRDSSVNWTRVESLVAEHFRDTRLHARAFLLIHKGELVLEQYGDGADADTKLLGWSATKSVVNALLGRLVKEGFLPRGLDTVVDLPASAFPEVSLRDALNMRTGLDWDEWYEPLFDVDDMLFKQQEAFMPRRGRRQQQQPVPCFQYSSHTTNALCRFIRQRLFEDDDAAYAAMPSKLLFEPLAARSFTLATDPSGTFVGSSFGFATARDWARLGLLFANNGVWEDRVLLPEGWVNFTASPAPTSGAVYGAHFWLAEETSQDPTRLDDAGTMQRCDATYPSRLDPPRGWLQKAFPPRSFVMHGFEEQLVAIIPEKDVVMVRLGATKEVVLSWARPEFYAAVLANFPDAED